MCITHWLELPLRNSKLKKNLDILLTNTFFEKPETTNDVNDWLSAYRRLVLDLAQYIEFVIKWMKSTIPTSCLIKSKKLRKTYMSQSQNDEIPDFHLFCFPTHVQSTV